MPDNLRPGPGGEAGAGAEGADDLGEAIRSVAGQGDPDPVEGEEVSQEGDPASTAATAPKTVSIEENEWKEAQTRLRELAEWKEEKERVFAEDVKRKEEAERNRQPVQRTDDDWRLLESNLGFSRTKVKNEVGEEVEQIGVNPRKMVEFLEGFGEHIAKSLRDEWENSLHENVNSIRTDRVFADLERDPSKAYSDIRQYSTAINEYMKRYAPKDRSNPEFIKDALFWARGRGIKDTIRKMEGARKEGMKVIHPRGGGAGAPPATQPESVRDGVARGFLDAAGWQ